MVEMTIDSIRVSLTNYQRVVILKEKGAGRYLPIWIGPAEADAIAVRLQEVTVPRPLTHDLLRSVIDALGATIDSIIVSDLKNDTFYARLVLKVDGGQMEIDSRPSDAIALALRFGDQRIEGHRSRRRLAHLFALEAAHHLAEVLHDVAGIAHLRGGRHVGRDEDRHAGVGQHQVERKTDHAEQIVRIEPGSLTVGLGPQGEEVLEDG